MTSFCAWCGTTDQDAQIGTAIGICLDAEACHRRQAERREYRAYVAEMIARAIEESVCAPGKQCYERFCQDCIRWRQAQADAATARRAGANTAPVTTLAERPAGRQHGGQMTAAETTETDQRKDRS